MRLYTFVSKVITPAVLLLGLLVLAVFHFSGVLANTQSIDNIYHGVQAYSNGPMAYTFQELAGTDRPDVNYNGISLLTYVDWSSTMSIDGHVSNLWDNFHGYDYDRQNPNDTEFFSTTSGTGWQLIEVVKLTSNHSVTVSYSFVARTETLAEPHHVIRDHRARAPVHVPADHQRERHSRRGFFPMRWTASPAVIRRRRSARSRCRYRDPRYRRAPLYWIRSAPIRTRPAPIRSSPIHFATTYVIQDPDVNRMTPLGTETINFTPTRLRNAGLGTGAGASRPHP